MGEITQFFSSSSISIIFQSYFINGGLLEVIVHNFVIFLTLIGAFSLYCYFYFNITFHANVISEYPESQQQNLKIFLQILFLTLILFGFYIVAILIYHLSIKPAELVMLILFFGLTILSGFVFSDYVKKIRPKYDNMVQFAAIRDSIKKFDSLIYFTSVFGFIFPFILILYGMISNFNIFSIFFIICFVLIVIWQINIINNEPRSIFDIKIKGSTKQFQGFVLTNFEKDVIQIFDGDDANKDKIIQIPRTSIEYIILNRKINKSEMINFAPGIFETIVSIWNSIVQLKDFLKTLTGFTFGAIVGIVLSVIIMIIDSGFSYQTKIFIVFFSFLFFVLGILICHDYHKSHTKKDD
jgi:hypothetical protein